MLTTLVVVLTLLAVACKALGARLAWNCQFRAHTGTRGGEPLAVIPTVDSLRVLSHNVWCHYLVAAPNRKARLAALAEQIAAALPRYDVVMVQELFIARFGPFIWCEEWELFTTAMKRLGLIYHTNPADSLARTWWPFPVQNSGLMIYSRYPLSAVSGCAFSLTDEVLNRKGMVHASVRLNTGGMVRSIHFVDTHLDSRKWDTKKAQLLHLAAVLAKQIPAEDGLVVAGDFNVCSNQKGVHGGQYAFLSSLLDARALRDAFGDRRTPTMRDTPPRLQLLLEQMSMGVVTPGAASLGIDGPGFLALDHMFYTHKTMTPSSAQVLDWRIPGSGRGVSDHMGIGAEFHFHF